MKKNKFWLLLFSLALPQLAGAIGSFATLSEINNWYQFINKPFFNPPNWIFGPVWTTLFLLMGFSFYLILIIPDNKKNIKLKEKAIFIFLCQLFLNTIWSFLFFKYKLLFLAFLEILILLIFVILNIYYFSKLNKLASILLIPYFLWVSFASILNFYIWKLNNIPSTQNITTEYAYNK